MFDVFRHVLAQGAITVGCDLLFLERDDAGLDLFHAGKDVGQELFRSLLVTAAGGLPPHDAVTAVIEGLLEWAALVPQRARKPDGESSPVNKWGLGAERAVIRAIRSHLVMIGKESVAARIGAELADLMETVEALDECYLELPFDPEAKIRLGGTARIQSKSLARLLSSRPNDLTIPLFMFGSYEIPGPNFAVFYSGGYAASGSNLSPYPLPVVGDYVPIQPFTLDTPHYARWVDMTPRIPVIPGSQGSGLAVKVDTTLDTCGRLYTTTT